MMMEMSWHLMEMIRCWGCMNEGVDEDEDEDDGGDGGGDQRRRRRTSEKGRC